MEKRIVTSTSLFAVDDTFKDDRFMRVRCTVMHSGKNRNNSSFSHDVIMAAKDSFANIPILADVEKHVDENGNEYLDYTTHAMHVEQDAFDPDQDRVIYDEKVVGIVPETNNFEVVEDKETGNNYYLVDALIYKQYGNYAADILAARGGRTDVSAEISCDDMAYNSKDKCLEVGKMRMCAVTLLGASVVAGMKNAHAEVFSMDEESRTNQLIQIMQELKESLDNYTKLQKGETNVETDNNVFEEGVTPAAEESTTEETVITEAAVATEENAPEEVTPAATPDSRQISVTYANETKTYAISVNDKVQALEILINDTYSEADNDYYYVDVFEGNTKADRYVVMHGWNGSFKQAYKEKDGVYSLSGDRVPVRQQYLTDDEIAALDAMRSNYAAVTDKLAKYEAEPAKMELLNSADYSQVANTEEFIELKKVENHFDLAFEEVEKKADEIVLAFSKAQARTTNFAAVEPTVQVAAKGLVHTPKKTGRYGNIFSK